MKLDRLAITGDAMFIKRRAIMIDALRDRVPQVDVVETGGYYTSTIPGMAQLLYYRARYRRKDDGGRWRAKLHKTRRACAAKSREAASLVNSMVNAPDHILHMHAMYAPVELGRADRPTFSIFTDYTAALCARNWEPWRPHPDPRKCIDWIDCQRAIFEAATHIFTYSTVARDSMCDDYGIQSEKITVVGHAGDMRRPFEGEIPIGSKQLLLNGSDWTRKGGDIALEAFRIVRDRIPRARMVVIGCQPRERVDGVEYRGHVTDRDELHKLFLSSDLLVAPARCDPLPTLGVEAMSFGLPPVVSDRDGMPEMVGYGQCGSVASLDPQSVASEIITLLEDDVLLRAKSDAAREKVSAMYNWDTITNLMVETWRKL